MIKHQTLLIKQVDTKIFLRTSKLGLLNADLGM